MARRTVSVIEGGDELLKKLRDMGVGAQDVLEAAVRAGAEIVAQTANGYAPEPLIAIDTVSKKISKVTVDVGPPDDKWYWKFFETGVQTHEIPGPLSIEFEGVMHIVGGADHPGMAARPFMRPAFDSEKSNAVKVAGDRIKEVLT